jgi:hypothetical protein
MSTRGPMERPVQRTPEQHAAVRRRALPAAVAGVLLGLASVLLAATTHVSAVKPPSLLGANLAFCAMLMGAGLLFYIRGTSGTRPAAALAVAALLLGMAGNLHYVWQAVQTRQARENLELANVQAIARAASDYAAVHHGAYPPDLLALLEDGRLKPRTLQSPYGPWHPLLAELAAAQPGTTTSAATATTAQRPDLLRALESSADYFYLGGDLKNVPADAAGALIVAVSANTVLRINLAIAFADGTSRFLTINEVPGVIAQGNAARRRLGLGDLRPPPILQMALDESPATGRR